MQTYRFDQENYDYGTLQKGDNLPILPKLSSVEPLKRGYVHSEESFDLAALQT